MNIALVQCPAWNTGNPPYALALLSAVLRQAGHRVDCHDLNIELYRRSCQNPGGDRSAIRRESWENRRIETDWIDRGKVARFLAREAPTIDRAVDSILSRPGGIVGLSLHVTSRLFSLELARRIKEKDPKRVVLLGGPDCFPNYDRENILKTYPFVDAVCHGAAEDSLPEFVARCEKSGRPAGQAGYGVRTARGKILDGGDMPAFADLDRFPFADYGSFPLEQYTERWLPLMASRGCIRRCRFCTENVHWGRYRSRSARRVADEIRYQTGRFPARFRYVWFTDPLFNGNMAVLDELCDLLIAENPGVRWSAMVAIREEMTVELLRKMKRAGCDMLHIGLESGSDKVLGLMNKGYSTALAREVIRRIHRAGIRFNTNVIVGFPGETEADFLDTVRLVRRLKRHGIRPAPATLGIHPGSYLFAHMDELGVFFPAQGGDWRSRDGTNTPQVRKERQAVLQAVLDARSVLPPVRAAREEFVVARYRARQAFAAARDRLRGVP